MALTLVACGDDDDGGPFVFLDAGTGGPGSSCVNVTDCHAGLECVLHECVEPVGVGEPCAADEGCEPGLACVGGTCAEVGAEGQPCDLGGACDDGLACDGTACRPAVQARLCHCIYTTPSLNPVQVEMEIGTQLVGPWGPDSCSPCQPVPSGTGVPYEIRRTENGAVLQTGALDIPPGSASFGVVFSAGVFEVGAIACDREPAPFCQL
ncbi:hypothetical protein [Sandaracinus amylolyticus]|uniref:Uncharacterized protein n=1 Tax=Sandaracinus amylolyticus TaxID=927083 RepID=A0A0F6YL50_9BACT|nr:hypothetical protein [Sandaracinus amylolyticus]AKF09953.1 hypothetical protein DB32_007102 [Sandaracinus amylolyticus]